MAETKDNEGPAFPRPYSHDPVAKAMEFMEAANKAESALAAAEKERDEARGTADNMRAQRDDWKYRHELAHQALAAAESALSAAREAMIEARRLLDYKYEDRDDLKRIHALNQKAWFVLNAALTPATGSNYPLCVCGHRQGQHDNDIGHCDQHCACERYTPATGEGKATMPKPNRMDAPDGPECACGKPSRTESGWCGECQPEAPSVGEERTQLPSSVSIAEALEGCGCLCTVTSSATERYVTHASTCPKRKPTPPPSPDLVSRAEVLRIIREQPNAEGTHTGTRQQWVRDELMRKVEALPSSSTDAHLAGFSFGAVADLP